MRALWSLANTRNYFWCRCWQRRRGDDRLPDLKLDAMVDMESAVPANVDIESAVSAKQEKVVCSEEIVTETALLEDSQMDTLPDQTLPAEVSGPPAPPTRHPLCGGPEQQRPGVSESQSTSLPEEFGRFRGWEIRRASQPPAPVCPSELPPQNACESLSALEPATLQGVELSIGPTSALPIDPAACHIRSSDSVHSEIQQELREALRRPPIRLPPPAATAQTEPPLRAIGSDRAFASLSRSRAQTELPTGIVGDFKMTRTRFETDALAGRRMKGQDLVGPIVAPRHSNHLCCDHTSGFARPSRNSKEVKEVRPFTVEDFVNKGTTAQAKPHHWDDLLDRDRDAFTPRITRLNPHVVPRLFSAKTLRPSVLQPDEVEQVHIATEAKPRNHRTYESATGVAQNADVEAPPLEKPPPSPRGVWDFLLEGVSCGYAR